MKYIIPVVVLLIGVSFSDAATAQTRAENIAQCDSNDLNVRIKGCTALINTANETTAVLVAAYNNRGGAYTDTHQYDKAIPDLDQAIHLNPNSSQSYHNRALAYSGMSQYQRAIADFDEAIRLKSDYATAYENRGAVYGSLKQYDKAIADEETAIRLAPNDAKAYYNRGTAYIGSQQYDKAIADYDNAIRLNPNYTSAYKARGTVKQHIGDSEGGEADLAKAKELGLK